MKSVSSMRPPSYHATGSRQSRTAKPWLPQRAVHYAELDHLSSRDWPSDYLIELGVGPDRLVPICFEKSMWTIVAMLGILKAGGAFVPIDPSHPASRRQALVKEIRCSADAGLTDDHGRIMRRPGGASWYTCLPSVLLRSYLYGPRPGRPQSSVAGEAVPMRHMPFSHLARQDGRRRWSSST